LWEGVRSSVLSWKIRATSYELRLGRITKINEYEEYKNYQNYPNRPSLKCFMKCPTSEFMDYPKETFNNYPIPSREIKSETSCYALAKSSWTSRIEVLSRPCHYLPSTQDLFMVPIPMIVSIVCIQQLAANIMASHIIAFHHLLKTCS
jgi:hypothetical protein